MVGAGGVTFLVQRERVLSAVDARLTEHVAAASNVVTGASGAQDLSGGTTGTTSSLYSTTSSALAAITSAVLPAANESSIAVLDGQPAYVPGVEVPFRLEDDPELLARIVARGERRDRPARRGRDADPASPVHRDSRRGRTTEAPGCSSPRSMWTPSSPS